MLCSKCSASVKPIACIDIDGTLADWHASFLNFAHRYLGRQLAHVEWDGAQPFHEWMGISKEQYRQMKLAHRQGGWKRWMPAFEGAAKFVEYLREIGYEVWLTTTRPYLRFDSLDPDTREWLNRNGIAYDYLFYNEDKYAEILGVVDPQRILFVYDDEPEQCVRADQLGLNVYQRANQWNVHNRGDPFANFPVMLAEAQKLYEEWSNE